MASSSMFSSLLQSLPSSKFSFRVTSGIGTFYNPVLGLLESKLANQLELLTRPPSDHQDLSYLSARWLHNAMSTVIFANSNAKTSIVDLQNALSDSGSYCKWLDECLDDNIRVLDTCLILQESLSCSKLHLSYVKAILGTLMHPADKQVSKARLLRAAHAVSQCVKLAQQKNTEMGSKRSKLETCGSVLRRMGEKLYSLEDQYKGNGWGVMYVAHMITIFVCGVMVTAFSVGGPKKANMSTISISSQSNWWLALSALQQRIKEEVETKRIQKMPYLEELEKMDSLFICLTQRITQALEDGLFPVLLDEEKPMKKAMGDLQRCVDELGHGLAKLEQDITELYQELVTSRMMLLDIYPKSSAIPRVYLELDEPKRQN
ncbi:hypothetical protein GOP47_0014197 [Adiantum capillus-veneris]|uniref:Uncharacterized protein n=1 Tax=Adiantum capillus-veneris TaxID=13818 RepID=A0A9D4UQ71_ADICA|nr:hypothetical protein GOP47_0014197 [Adiantum capillus-veneris]